MLLQLGDDEPGRGYLEHFKSFGIETRNIKLLKDQDTGKIIDVVSSLGQAYILALKDGHNSIIINCAANAAYDPEMKELDPKWAEAVRESKYFFIKNCLYQARSYFCKGRSQSMLTSWLQRQRRKQEL